MKFVQIKNKSRSVGKPVRARYCSSFFCRLRGLMFQKTLDPYEGLLMVQSRADRVESSIHMLFMMFDLAVVWLDDQYRVVDVQLCRRWRPAYIPAGPARFVLETHTERLSDFTIGDRISVELCA
jgi:uncharacterized protein